PDGTSLGSFGGDYTGTGQSGPIVLPVDGNYFVRVSYNYTYFGEYRLRVTTIAPPAQIETEGNDSIGAANVPALTFAVGQQSATVLASIHFLDPGDYYRLGNLASGTQIRLSLNQPVDSPLLGVMGVYNSVGTLITNSLPGATNLLYAIPVAGDGIYYARITASGATTGLASQYLLNLVLADVVPPFITSLNLPAEASTNAIVVDRFTMGFSEDMIASRVLNAGNYELRSAGDDNVFGTGDDQLYTISCTGYSTGLSASYVVTDGPLQSGSYRFTVSTNLQDRAGNGLVADYMRLFTIAPVPGFIFETRNNDTVATATLLSLAPVNSLDGSFVIGSPIGVGANPYFVATGNFNADSHLDLVTANISSANISILLGRGDGTFMPATNYAAGNGPIALAVGDINGDGINDVATADYYGSTASILLGNGNGSFRPPTNYIVGTNPRSIKLGDFNGDGKLDFVTANTSSSTISVSLGNGDGTFGPRTTYIAGSAPHGVAIGDFNADAKPDLIVVNQNTDNASLLLGNGDGTFSAATSITTDPGPRSVAVGDINGDGKLDFASINHANNSISVVMGNGNGTFQPKVSLGIGSSDPYHIILADLDASGSMDVVTANYSGNRVTVLFNNGNGTFSSPSIYSPGGNPIAVAAGDFYGNGRIGIASANYSANNVSILSPTTSKPLAEDPPGSGIRSSVGRGNLFNTSDVDHWSFSAKAGDYVTIASEVPGNPNGSGLYFRIDRPDGIVAGDFYAEFNGAGQSGPILIPISGTYTFRVSYNYTYFGEYRFRVTVASPPTQLESEANNTVAQANAIALPLVGGHKTATVLGSIHASDSPGDYFRLGNLGEGTTIQLGLSQPLTSGLSAVLGIFNNTGLVVTNGPAGETNLVYTIPNGAGGIYHARVISTNNTAGLLSQYLLTLDISDTRPTFVTTTTLPTEGSSISSLFDQFNVTVNKDLDPVFSGVNRTILFRNGRAYTLTTGSPTWFASEAQAQSAGGHLVTIDDQAENDWLQQNFSGAGTFWIGLTDDAIEAAFVWSSGDPVGFTYWTPGQPDNSSNEDFAAILSNGRWNDYNGATALPGVIEVAGADADSDGIPDTLDIYAGDPLNAFDLRATGPDGLFNTADDQIYRLRTSPYSSGLTVTFNLVDGPLQAGNYRFTVTSSLRDLFGNSLATAFVRTFTVNDVPGYTLENRTNNVAALATPLPLVEDPSGLTSAAGRGRLFDAADVDFWSFTGTTGQVLTVAAEIPGNPGSSSLYYRIHRPDGTLLTDFYSVTSGSGLITPVILPTNGTYTIRVSPNNNYFGEYHLRASIALPPMQMETEANESIAAASPVTLVTNAAARLGSIAGYIGSSGDLDYYSLGTITNGASVFLNTRLPSTSALTPVVSLYNASNVYLNEAPGGRASDGVAQVNVTQTGIYYAVVRGANGIGGLGEQYVLDVQVVPTGSVSFPNLQVSAVVPPGGGNITSGQPVTLSFTVQNIGSVATPVSSWADRVVISKNTVLG
ncbi:MAG: VCBS repeat-containing protein, partial [Opitutaceae bacterium]|nr:VCBS repeat-containing protein [Verrucomicrobiales bacterium]